MPLMFLSKQFVKLSTIALTFQVKIAMVGKYTGLSDSYLSVIKVTLLLFELKNENLTKLGGTRWHYK